ncbi:hypothetical protein [Psychroserpens sp. MEBiC05023]
MNKNHILFALLFILNINLLFSQSFEIPGEIMTNDGFKKGFFSEEINEYTTALSFKISENDEIVNLFSSENIRFKFNSNRNLYKTLNVNGYIHPFIVIVDGKASFYKDITQEVFYIQNPSVDPKIVKFEDFEKANKNTRNVGILSLVFGDCISVRTQLKKTNINKSTITQLTKDYNNCKEYSDSYELSSKQKKEQEYLKQKGVYSIDIGGSLLLNNFKSQVRAFQEGTDKSNILGYGAFVSFNMSPSYFNQMRDKLFVDISISYNLTPEFSVEFYDVKRSNILLNLSPTYYFLRDKSINPFARINFGLNYSKYELVKNVNTFLMDVKGNRKSFIFSLEAGVQFNRQFEVSLHFQPRSEEVYTVYLNNTFDIENTLLSLKASYIFDLSKKD